MSVIREVSEHIRGLCKKAQVWGHYSPAHDNQASSAMGKALLKAPIASIGGQMGAAMGAVNGISQNGFLSLFGRGNAKDTWKQIGQGALTGTKTGWREAGRAYSDLANVGTQLAGDFGLLGDGTVGKVNRWNSEKILDSMRRSDVDIPDNVPRDPITGSLVATGDPRYADYDRFVNSADYGQLSGRAAIGLYAGIRGGQALGKAAPTIAGKIGAGPRIARLAQRAGYFIPGAIPVGIDANKTRKRTLYEYDHDQSRRKILEFISAMNNGTIPKERYDEAYSWLNERINKYPEFAELPEYLAIKESYPAR